MGGVAQKKKKKKTKGRHLILLSKIIMVYKALTTHKQKNFIPSRGLKLKPMDHL